MQCTKLTYDFANLFNMSDGLALPQRPLIIPAVIRQVIHFFPETNLGQYSGDHTPRIFYVHNSDFFPVIIPCRALLGPHRLVMGRFRYLKSVSVFGIFSVWYLVSLSQNIAISVSVFGTFSTFALF